MSSLCGLAFDLDYVVLNAIYFTLLSGRHGGAGVDLVLAIDEDGGGVLGMGISLHFEVSLGWG